MRLGLASESERVARDRLTWTAWGGGLTHEQFLERERLLRAHPFARDTMRTWLWSDDECVLASCETFAMPTRVRDGTREREGTAEAVASVFTEPRLRGRGHAASMMGALLERLRSEATDASVLFSDVGASLYERAGYRLREAGYRMLDPVPGDPREGIDGLLAPADGPQTADALRLPEDEFLVRPTWMQVDWHLERERYYRRVGGHRPLEHIGAQCGEDRILWTADYKNGRLDALWLDATSSEAARRLLTAAARFAAAASLGSVRLWEDGHRSPAAEGSGRSVERPDCMPMVAPLAPTLRADRWRFIPRVLWV